MLQSFFYMERRGDSSPYRSALDVNRKSDHLSSEVTQGGVNSIHVVTSIHNGQCIALISLDKDQTLIANSLAEVEENLMISTWRRRGQKSCSTMELMRSETSAVFRG